jgi:hypothetical protein
LGEGSHGLGYPYAKTGWGSKGVALDMVYEELVIVKVVVAFKIFIGFISTAIDSPQDGAQLVMV